MTLASASPPDRVIPSRAQREHEILKRKRPREIKGARESSFCNPITPYTRRTSATQTRWQESTGQHPAASISPPIPIHEEFSVENSQWASKMMIVLQVVVPSASGSWPAKSEHAVYHSGCSVPLDAR